MSLKKIFSNYRFSIILLVAIFAGMISGLILSDKSISFLTPFGTVFMNMLFTIVVPLVFFTISSSIASMSNRRRLGKIFGYMLLVFGITSLLACIFMLVGVWIVDPVGKASIPLTEGVKESVDLASSVVDMFTVSDFEGLLNKSHMFPLIIFSILFGLSVNLVGEEAAPLKKMLDVCSKAFMKFIGLIMYYAPIGLFAYFASLTNQYGPTLIGSYAKSMIFYLVMALLYYFIFYPLYISFVKGKKGIRPTLKHMFLPTVTALGTCSSLATLPVNITASEKIGVAKDVGEVALPIGATMHMEGSSMASILKIAFLFSIFGKSFTSIDTVLIAILISVLSGVVMSGIPGGGLIGELLIVTLYDFPLTAFPIIATIGWLIDAPATALNAVGDIPSTMMISKLVDKTEQI